MKNCLASSMKFLQKARRSMEQVFIKGQNRNCSWEEEEKRESVKIINQVKAIHEPEKDLLQAPCFYWPDLNHNDSQELMKNMPDGTFLVRKSSHSEHKYAVTYKKAGTVASMRIQFCNEKLLYSFNLASRSLPQTHTIRELVAAVSGENIKTTTADPKTEKMGTMRLEYPVYRTPSLMEQCKSRILDFYPNRGNIDELGSALPQSLIHYLKQ